VAGAIADLGRRGAPGWTVEAVLPTTSTVAVATVSDGRGDGVLKVAMDDLACTPLRAQCRSLGELHADERLGPWRRLLPPLLDHGQLVGHTYVLEGRLPGREARHCAITAERLTDRAIPVISQLHRRSSCPAIVGESLLRRWIDEPLEVLLAAVDRRWRSASRRSQVERLRRLLRAGLSGRAVRTGWIHGDFWPGNVLLTPDGLVTGIVDWGQADRVHLGVLDVAHWLLSLQDAGRHRELGARVTGRLQGRCWSEAERSWLLGAQQESEPLGEPLVLLMCWLGHVVSNLRKARAYSTSPIWLTRNVAPVLRQVADG
jgi:Phosphotransferase enzyme family